MCSSFFWRRINGHKLCPLTGESCKSPWHNLALSSLFYTEQSMHCQGPGRHSFYSQRVPGWMETRLALLVLQAESSWEVSALIENVRQVYMPSSALLPVPHRPWAKLRVFSNLRPWQRQTCQEKWRFVSDIKVLPSLSASQTKCDKNGNPDEQWRFLRSITKSRGSASYVLAAKSPNSWLLLFSNSLPGLFSILDCHKHCQWLHWSSICFPLTSNQSARPNDKTWFWHHSCNRATQDCSWDDWWYWYWLRSPGPPGVTVNSKGDVGN